MTTPLHGLTPAQIRKAIYGESKKEIVADIVSKEKKIVKPEKEFRETQKHDLGFLLDLSYSTTQVATNYPVPEWFRLKQKADVSVVVPIFQNDAKNLIETWDLVNDGLRVELVFVDDFCPVNSKGNVLKNWEKRSKSPVGQIIYCMAQQGWPACCNVGAIKATSDLVVFLHPNTKLTKGWLKPFTRLLRKSDVGIVGGLQINDSDNSILDAGSEWIWNNEDFLIIGNQCYDRKLISKSFKINNMPADLQECQEREKVSSSCMAVRRNDFLSLGGFSAQLGSQTWSDADLCSFFREKGLKVMYQPTVPFIRDPDLKPDKHHLHGKTYFINKWVSTGRLNSLAKDVKKTADPNIESIMIRRSMAHGDVLLAAAVAPALKKKYPNAKIIFSTDCPEVLRNNPWIDRIFKEQSERLFQLYINLDMAYEYRPNTNLLVAYAETAGVSPANCELFLDTDPIENLPDDYVVVHAGKTLWVGRNWSHLKFDGISKKLKEIGCKVICVGTENDHKTVVCDLDLRGQTTIHQLATVIKKAKLFIGIDSFPMHIAQTFNVPGAVFFGAIQPQTRLIRKNITPIYAEGLKCLGCHHKKPTPCTTTVTCDVGVQDCINNVSVEMFWKSITQHFEKSNTA